MSDHDTVESIKRRALSLVRLAEDWGVVLTITQHPDKPLAMGNHYTVVEARPARDLDPVTKILREGGEA